MSRKLFASFFKTKKIKAESKMSAAGVHQIKTLNDFGYGFNSDGVLKVLDPNSGDPTDEGFQFKDQSHYEALGDTITEHVYDLLEQKGMHKVHVCENVPKEQSAFIFMSTPKLDRPKKLLVLIHGAGAVRAGQWARSLIINHSLSHGTQIPYIEKARELGYEVLITNTNDNYRNINGVEKAIVGHSSPEEHGCSIWEKYVMASNPESVAVVAHSYGGVVTVQLAKKYPQFFKDKVFAVGLTDSVHFMKEMNSTIGSHLMKIGRNWVTSNKSLDTVVSDTVKDIPRYSAGHVKHEWTSYSCISALFKFVEEKYKNFTHE